MQKNDKNVEKVRKKLENENFLMRPLEISDFLTILFFKYYYKNP